MPVLAVLSPSPARGPHAVSLWLFWPSGAEPDALAAALADNGWEAAGGPEGVAGLADSVAHATYGRRGGGPDGGWTREEAPRFLRDLGDILASNGVVDVRDGSGGLPGDIAEAVHT